MYNARKSVVAERFIRKSRIYKYVNSVSNNVSINKLDSI